MKEITHVIQSEYGLHARPAGHLVGLLSVYNSRILICKGNATANAKSILKVMALGAQKGDEIRFTINGEDEVPACTALAQFLHERL